MQSPYFQERGYWAVILGGSSGIGLATAHKLAAEGMHLFILHRDRRKAMPEIEAEFESIRALGVKCISMNLDAIHPDNIVKGIARIQEEMAAGEGIRLLLHAISKGSLKLMAPYAAEPTDPLDSAYLELKRRFAERWGEKQPVLERIDYQITLEAMALSLMDWVQAIFEANLFVPDDARIIGLTSEGNQKAWRNYAAVSAAKAALEAVSRSIALEFAPHGIRSNVIQAGVTDTPSLRMIPGSEDLLKHAAMRNPFGRNTQASEVADVIYLLCRDESAWINGALIPVDGGEKNQ